MRKIVTGKSICNIKKADSNTFHIESNVYVLSLSRDECSYRFDKLKVRSSFSFVKEEGIFTYDYFVLFFFW